MINRKELAYKYILTLSELSNSSKKFIDKTNFESNELIELSNKKLVVKPESVRKLLLQNNVKFKFKVISHINLKGGIGKTTSTVSVSSRAAQYGFKTCIIDLDPQGSASLAFNKLPREESDDIIFYDLWQKPEDLLIKSLKKIQDNFFILPSSLENAMLDSSLINPKNLKKAVLNTCRILEKSKFDLVFIDCPPSLGAATISSICASDTVVIPVWNDSFSMKGLDLTLSEIVSISETFNIDPPEVKVLFSKYDKREKISSETIEKLEKRYSNYLIPIYIRTSTEFSKSLRNNETIFASNSKNNAKDDYDMYTKNLLNITI